MVGNLSGDVTTSGSAVATLANIPNDTPMTGDLLATAIAAPATPAAGKGRIYVDSTAKNIAVKDDAGVVKHGVQSKAAVSTNFLTAISDAGVVSAAQPTDADLSLSAITTNDVSTTKHGFAPTLPNDATKFLNGTGAYSVPTGTGAGGLFTPPPLTSWSWDNQGTSSVDETGPGILLTSTTVASGLRIRYRTAPATPYTISAALYIDFRSGADVAADFGFRDSAGKLILWHMAVGGVAYVFKFTNSTTPVAAYNSFTSSQMFYDNPVWLQITDDGTNLIFRWRLGNSGWQTFVTSARNNFFATAPNAIAWGSYNNNGATYVTLASYDGA